MIVDEIIRIAREKPDDEARGRIAQMIARPVIGWMTGPDGKRVPLMVGQADAR